MKRFVLPLMGIAGLAAACASNVATPRPAIESLSSPEGAWGSVLARAVDDR